MQVRELALLGKYLRTVLQEKNLVELYKNLINAVNQAAQNQNPQNVSNILEKIRDIHVDAQKKVLSPAQHKLLVEYGAEGVVGVKALDRTVSSGSWQESIRL